MVIGVIVTENKTLLSVSWIPINHPEIFPARDFANQTLWNINAMMKNRRMKIDILQKSAYCDCGQQSGIEKTPQYPVRKRFPIENAARIKSKRPGKGMLAHITAFESELRNFA